MFTEGHGVYLVVRKAIASGKIALEEFWMQQASIASLLTPEKVDNP